MKTTNGKFVNSKRIWAKVECEGKVFAKIANDPKVYRLDFIQWTDSEIRMGYLFSGFTTAWASFEYFKANVKLIIPAKLEPCHVPTI